MAQKTCMALRGQSTSGRALNPIHNLNEIDQRRGPPKQQVSFGGGEKKGDRIRGQPSWGLAVRRSPSVKASEYPDRMLTFHTDASER